MPTTRISETARRVLRNLAQKTGQSMQEVLENAVEEYRRSKFLEESNAAFAALRHKPESWKEEQEERAIWETTLVDDLNSD